MIALPSRSSHSSRCNPSRCSSPASVTFVPIRESVSRPLQVLQLRQAGVGDPAVDQRQLAEAHQSSQVSHAGVADGGVIEREVGELVEMLEVSQAGVGDRRLVDREVLEVREGFEVSERRRR